MNYAPDGVQLELRAAHLLVEDELGALEQLPLRLGELRHRRVDEHATVFLVPVKIISINVVYSDY